MSFICFVWAGKQFQLLLIWQRIHINSLCLDLLSRHHSSTVYNIARSDGSSVCSQMFFFYEKRHQNAESLFRKKLFKNWVPCRANKYIKIFFLQRTLPTFLTVFFTQAPVIRILKLQQNTTIILGIALKREIWVQFPITMWCFGKLYKRLF